MTTPPLVRMTLAEMLQRYQRGYAASRRTPAQIQADILTGLYDQFSSLLETKEWGNDFALQYLFGSKWFDIDIGDDVERPSFPEKLAVFEALWQHSVVFKKPLPLLRLLTTTVRTADEAADDADQTETIMRWRDAEDDNFQSIFHIATLSLMTAEMWRGVADIALSDFLQNESYQRYAYRQAGQVGRDIIQVDVGIPICIVLQYGAGVLTDAERETLEDRKRSILGAEEPVPFDTQLQFAELDIAGAIYFGASVSSIANMRRTLQTARRRLCIKEAAAAVTRLYVPGINLIELAFVAYLGVPCIAETLTEQELGEIVQRVHNLYQQNAQPPRTSRVAAK